MAFGAWAFQRVFKFQFKFQFCTFLWSAGNLVPLWIREDRKLSAVWKARHQAKICLNASRFPGLIQSSAWPEHSKFAKLEPSAAQAETLREFRYVSASSATAESKTTTYAYDVMDRKTSTTYTDGSVTAIDYDPSGSFPTGSTAHKVTWESGRAGRHR